SSAASAANVIYANGTGTAPGSEIGATPTVNPVKTVNAQIFGSAAGGIGASGTIGPLGVVVKFNNTYGGGLKPNVILTVTGASFAASSLNGQSAANVKLISDAGTGGGTLVGTLNGAAAACSVGVIGN